MIADLSTYSICRVPPDDLHVTFRPLTSVENLEALWLDLERRSECSFFQSWIWIGRWLQHLPSCLAPRVLSVWAGSEVVGLGILVARRETRHGLLSVRSLHLNESGDPRIDPLGLEYNGLIADRRIGNAAVAQCCLIWLVEQEDDWDELSLGGLDAGSANVWVEAADGIGLGVRTRAKSCCRYVDLQGIRQKGTDYLSTLSRNTRGQIRRALRLYEADGPIAIAAARDFAEARDFLEELRELHQESWARRGMAGAFSNQAFGTFHGELIAAGFDADKIQLLRVSTGPRALGYLYNLVKEGWVYAYQSGFRYNDDPRLKPGLSSHCFAIQYNLAQGAMVYDFMAGDSRYKRSLGTESHELSWLVVQRPRARLQIENALRAVRRRFAGQTELS